MKPILNIAALLMLPTLCQAQMVVQNGATIKTTGNAVIALQDINLVNNGTISQQSGEGKFIFTGTLPNTISGTSITTQFDSLLIAKTGTGKVSLLQNITVGSGIKMTSGKIDMLNNNINLLPAAKLVGETETGHITSTGTGYITITLPLNGPVGNNPGNLGAVISSMQNLGSTVIKRGHQSQVNAFNSGNSLTRYYDITPTNNTGLNATLRIDYLDAELNGLTETDLNMFRSTDNVTWQNMGFNNRNATSNYVEKNGITAFSRWTLSSSSNPLPLEFTEFTAECDNGNVNLSWTTAQAQNVNYFEVEHSNDAAVWQPAAKVSYVAGKHTYNFDVASQQGFYRIAAVDFDGSSVFSGVQKVACGKSDAQVEVWPNPTTASVSVKLNAATADPIFVRIYDSRGAEIETRKFNLLKGENQISVDLSSFAAGVYWLKMDWNNGAEQKSVKVIKQ